MNTPPPATAASSVQANDVPTHARPTDGAGRLRAFAAAAEADIHAGLGTDHLVTDLALLLADVITGRPGTLRTGCTADRPPQPVARQDPEPVEPGRAAAVVVRQLTEGFATADLRAVCEQLREAIPTAPVRMRSGYQGALRLAQAELDRRYSADCDLCEEETECGCDGDHQCVRCGGTGWCVREHCCVCGGSPYCSCCPRCGKPSVGDCPCPIPVALSDGTTLEV